MSLDDTSPEVSGNERFAFTVNGARYKSHDAVKVGRQLLQTAGFAPASEFVLIQVMRPGSRSIGLDEEVDLSDGDRKEFRAFASDRVFSFTADEIGYEWGAGSITEKDLRDITGTPPGKRLVLDCDDEEDDIVEPGSAVDLAERGTEHFYTEKQTVTVYYADDHFELERGRYTGAQLAVKFGVPAGYVLDLVKPNNDFQEIKAGDTLKIREGMRFVSHPPCGQSS